MKQTSLSLLLTLLPLAASADAVEIDGIYYNLVPKGKVAEVVSNYTLCVVKVIEKLQLSKLLLPHMYDFR